MAKETGRLISEPSRLANNFLYHDKLVPLLRDGQREKTKKKAKKRSNTKKVNKNSKLHGNLIINARLGKIALDINARLWDRKKKITDIHQKNEIVNISTVATTFRGRPAPAGRLSSSARLCNLSL